MFAEYPQVGANTTCNTHDFISDSYPIPGLVQTEFQAAMYPDSPDKVAAIHNSVPCLQSEVRKMMLDDIFGNFLYFRTFPGQ